MRWLHLKFEISDLRGNRLPGAEARFRARWFFAGLKSSSPRSSGGLPPKGKDAGETPALRNTKAKTRREASATSGLRVETGGGRREAMRRAGPTEGKSKNAGGTPALRKAKATATATAMGKAKIPTLANGARMGRPPGGNAAGGPNGRQGQKRRRDASATKGKGNGDGNGNGQRQKRRRDASATKGKGNGDGNGNGQRQKRRRDASATKGKGNGDSNGNGQRQNPHPCKWRKDGAPAKATAPA